MGLKEIKSIIAIPARLDSKRLPGKILKDIGGEPMIKRVLNQCNKCLKKSEIVLCTDSNELFSSANDWGYKAFLTSNKCTSGSDRISSVIQEIIAYMWGIDLKDLTESKFRQLLKTSLIINVQGDQPFIDPNLLVNLKNKLLKFIEEPIVVTPVYQLKADKIHDPNIVKTLISHKEQAIYFSRAAIPFNREEKKSLWYKHFPYYGHVGVYGFRADILANWNQLPLSLLEEIESLEQLRLIEAGIKIYTFKTDKESFSIDTLSQLKKAREIWSTIVN